ncbi:MAG: hypothetical protein ACKO83_00270 [Roseiflexaceae bacterium]
MKDHRAKHWNTRDLQALDIRTMDGRVGLYASDKPLTTPAGLWVSHTTRDIISAIQREAWLTGKLDVTDINYFSLYATQYDLIAVSFPQLVVQLPHLLEAHDITLTHAPGPEHVDQLWAWRALVQWLAAQQCTLPNDDAAPDAHFIDVVTRALHALHPAQQTAVMTLYQNHRASLLLVLMVVLGQCTAEEYAEGIMIVLPHHPTFDMTQRKQYAKQLPLYMRDAQLACDYCTIMRRG